MYGLPNSEMLCPVEQASIEISHALALVTRIANERPDAANELAAVVHVGR
jgi:hypothetical protein